MEHDISAPSSLEPSSGPRSKPNDTSQRPPIGESLRSILILYSHLSLGLSGGSFLQNQNL
jgi:hypothetical protein